MHTQTWRCMQTAYKFDVEQTKPSVSHCLLKWTLEQTEPLVWVCSSKKQAKSNVELTHP